MNSNSTLRLIHKAFGAIRRGNGLEAIRHVRRLVRAIPHGPDIWGFLGDLEMGEELYGPAVRSYRKALALLERGEPMLAPDLPSGRPLDEAAMRCALGSALASAGQVEEAEASVRRATELRPCADHFVALGELLEATGRTDEALAAFHAAIEHTPHHVEGLYRTACAYMWTDPARAEKYFRRVLRRDPQHAMAMSALGHLLLSRDAIKAGQRWLRRAIRVGGAEALPHVYLGHHAWGEGRVDDAEQAYRAGMAAAPGDPHPWFALGDLKRDEGNLDDARRAYEEAIRVDPGCGDAILRLGKLHEEAGRPKEAITCFRRGLRLTPQHPWRDEVRDRIRGLEQGAS